MPKDTYFEWAAQENQTDEEKRRKECKTTLDQTEFQAAQSFGCKSNANS